VATKSTLQPRMSSNMREPQPATRYSRLRRTIEMWPYVFLIVSIIGLLYIAVNAATTR
jgi:hypothetical protein